MNQKLHLTEDACLEVRIPQEPHFAPDEVEIWYVDKSTELCLFHGSRQDVLEPQLIHVLRHFRAQPRKPGELNRLFLHFCLHSDMDGDPTLNQHLFEFPECETWLYPAEEDGQVVLEIAHIVPYAEPPICETKVQIVLSEAAFFQWILPWIPSSLSGEAVL